MIQSYSPWGESEIVLYAVEKNVAHPNMRPLQELLPKHFVTGFGQELKTQQAFLLLQEMIQSYFQPFVYVLETNGAGLGLKVVQISVPPPLIPHLGLT